MRGQSVQKWRRSHNFVIGALKLLPTEVHTSYISLDALIYRGADDEEEITLKEDLHEVLTHIANRQHCCNDPTDMRLG
jgi:hypothetical protein